MCLVARASAVLHLVRALLVQVLELRLAGQHRVHRAQQPVEVEVVVGLGPFLELGLHGVARLGPVGADLGQRQVALGELGAAAVDPVEDVHHHVERLVRAGDLLDVEVDVDMPSSRLSRADIVAHLRCQRRVVPTAGSTNSPSPAVPFCISSVTSIQSGSSFIFTGW